MRSSRLPARILATVAALLLVVLVVTWLRPAGCGKTPPAPAAPAAPRVLERLVLREPFGVTHPLQVVELALAAPLTTRRVHVVDEAGAPVPFQLVDGGRRLALLTDLPADQTRQWELRDGPAPQPVAAPVTLTALPGGGWELVNGQTGVRLPAPVEAAATAPDAVPAPVQGVRFRDGTWSGTGPNRLVFTEGCNGAEGTKLTGMEVRLLARGPLRAVAQVLYRFQHPEYAYGQQKLVEAGEGFYTCTITLEAGRPSVLFEEETDVVPRWSLDFHDAVHPTQARYRGHHSSKPEFGYEPGGGVYRASHARGALDAQVDLTYGRPRPAGYSTTPESWRRLAVWDPWCFDSGWYWQMYDAGAGPDAKLVGIFAGRASRAVGAAASGTGIWTAPPAAPGGRPRAGITVESHRRSADARVFPRSRFQWGLFVGTVGDDLKPPQETQPVNRQMNYWGGVGLGKLAGWTLEFPDPPQGYGGLYMSRDAVEALKAKLRADTSGIYGGGFHGYLYNVEPMSRPLIDLWADASGRKLAEAIRAVRDTARGMLDDFANGPGIYTVSWHYWHGGLAMMRHGVWIDQILADPRTTAEERQSVKAAAALFAYILWDEDFVPLETPHGLNLGTANMPVQQQGYRDFYALLLAGHPAFAPRAAKVEESVLGTVRGLVNESGAEIGCTHYIGASFAPTLNTLLQVKQIGRPDPFAREPRLAQFAEFYLNFLTPPEPRVGGRRALISVGDSSTEPSEIFGTLGTGFRDAAPALSARLLGAWQAGGKPHSGFFGTTLLMIDDRLPAADPALGDATFPGWYSVLRHGWGTPEETAAWVVNGDHYSDHRHWDHGTLVLYALGHPLACDWGAIYTPHTPGAYLHSTVLLESALGFAWDQDSPPLNTTSPWRDSTQEAFTSWPEGAYSRSAFRAGETTWTRELIVVRADPARPVIILRDRFAGPGATEPKVLSLNLMATGAVETPAGPVTPPERFHPATEHNPQDPAHQRPSATKPFELPAGAARLGFTGRYDVDVDVISVGAAPRQALLGNWGVNAWGGHITEREERQHILRVRSSEAELVTVLLPRRRGAGEPGTVRQEGAEWVIESAGTTVRLGADGYRCVRNGQETARRFAATKD